MVEKAKKQKKGTISEEDISIVLQRYSATTVLALLQEVAQVPDVKIDWEALAKKSATGISNAREYQMLWRHLAYHEGLVERLDDGAEPLNDDSDLEYEIEAFPSVSSEASAEAAACVKVLMASGLPSDSSLPNSSTVEAPLTINIPNGPSSRVSSANTEVVGSMKGTNITVPVSVQKQPLNSVTSAEGLDANGTASGSLPARRKRKPWSAAEDMELIAAVQKCGEGNWANILKGDFKGDRTASQLSQRWAIIRKRQGNVNVGGSSQLSEAQLAARRAVSLALNMPMGDNLKASCSNAGTNLNTTSNSAHPTASEPLMGGENSSQQGSVPATAHATGTPGSSLKFRVNPSKTLTKPSLGVDAMVKAAAVAAGARIATPSDAASLLKAAQAKKAVHIMPGGSSLIKSSIVGNSNPLSNNHFSAHHSVHRIVPSQTAKPLSSANPSQVSGTQQVKSHSVKPEDRTVQLNATSNTSSEIEGKTAEDNIPGSGSGSKEEAQEDQVAMSNNAPTGQAQENEATTLGNALEEQARGDQALKSGNVPDEHFREDHATLPNSNATSNCPMDIDENSECLGAETGGDEQVIVSDPTAVPNGNADAAKSTS